MTRDERAREHDAFKASIRKPVRLQFPEKKQLFQDWEAILKQYRLKPVLKSVRFIY